MMKNLKLAIIVLATAVGIASPVLARSAGHAGQNYSRGVTSDSPALNGGGSQGFNERARADY